MVENGKINFEDAEEESEKDYGLNSENFGQAVVWGTDWTTETVFSQLEKGNIDLKPSFQRRDAWSDDEKSRLIESLMLGIPVPPIILAENKEKRNSYLVIDGKQRLLSIRRFYSKVKENNKKEEFEDFLPLRLKNLDILKNLNGLTYDEMRNNYDEYITNIDNQSIRTIVIKNWPTEEFLYTVFLRLNTGSKKLSPQELRQALKPGPFLNYLDDVTAKSDAVKRMLNNKEADARMRDVELALRYFAFKYNIESYNGKLKDFLDDTCEKLNNKWKSKHLEIEEQFRELENSIDFAYTLFEKNPFSRFINGKSSNAFNRPIFELFTYYFSDPVIRKAIEDKKQDFVDKFIELNYDIGFTDSVSNTTKSIDRVEIRFSKFLNLLLELTKLKEIEFTELKLINRKIKIEKVIS